MTSNVDRSARFNLFFQEVSDAESFVFRGINLAKFFYDHRIVEARTLQRDSQKEKNRSVRTLLRHLLRFFAVPWKILRWKLRNKGRLAYLFFGASSLTRLNGELYDLYNPKILESIGRERVLVIEEQERTESKTYSPDLYLYDLLPILAIHRVLCRLLLGRQIHAFHARLQHDNPGYPFAEGVTRKIVLSFYSWFLTQKVFLRLASPACVVLICHYALQALIAACKQLEIKTIELMHGSILKLHPYYNAPQAPASFLSAFSRFMLPDEIGVYGMYWKENLVAGKLFSEQSVFIVGYFLQIEPPSRTPHSDPRTTILISTQAPFQRDWLMYIESLKRSLSPRDWRVLIKPHPNEKDEPYRRLAVPGFIEVNTDSVYTLLNLADIHLSVRSTVLYEALRYGVANYVLVVDSVARECQEIIDDGIGLPIHQGELPSVSAIPSKPASHFFAPFDPSLLLERLAGGRGGSA